MLIQHTYVHMIDGIDMRILNTFRMMLLSLDGRDYRLYHNPHCRDTITCCECDQPIPFPQPRATRIYTAAYHRDFKYLFVCRDCARLTTHRPRDIGHSNGHVEFAEIQYHGSRFNQGEW